MCDKFFPEDFVFWWGMKSDWGGGGREPLCERSKQYKIDCFAVGNARAVLNPA